MTKRKAGEPTHEFAPGMFMISDVVEKNGKTIRENNLEKCHTIPVGTLVEVKYEEWFGDGACEKVHARLWAEKHSRDCDGTPLYMLAKRKGGVARGHYSAESLTPVAVTKALLDGEGALSWEDDE